MHPLPGHSKPNSITKNDLVARPFNPSPACSDFIHKESMFPPLGNALCIPSRSFAWLSKLLLWVWPQACNAVHKQHPCRPVEPYMSKTQRFEPKSCWSLPTEHAYDCWIEGRSSSVGRERESWWGGPIPAVAARSLLVGSVSVSCDRLRQKSWSPSSVSCVAACKIVRRSALPPPPPPPPPPRYNLVVDENVKKLTNQINKDFWIHREGFPPSLRPTPWVWIWRF